MRRQSVIALIAITIIFVGGALPARADVPSQPTAEGITLIAIDTGASPDRADLDTAESGAIALVAGIRRGSVGVVRYGTGRGSINVHPAGPEAIAAVRSEMLSVRAQEGPAKSDQFGMLTEAFSYFTRVDAPAGSSVFLISPGRILGESESTRERLRSVGQLFSDEGWTISVATLPTSEAALRDLMAELPSSSGGVYFDLATPEGIQELLNASLGIALEPVMDVQLGNGPSAATVQVAPLTDRLDVIVQRSSRDVTTTVFRPNGAAATGDMPNVVVTESPRFVITSIESPVAGTWTLQAAGPGASISAGIQADNPINLKLVEQPPLPVGEQGRLMASPFVNGIAQAMPGAHILARVRYADGQASVYELRDSGVDGDEHAGDGVFSGVLPAPDTQGVNDVTLELRWDAFGAVVRSSETFRTEVFPSLTVTDLFAVDALEGDPARVAFVQVQTGEFPYPVHPSEITATIEGPDGAFEAEVRPRHETEPGKAWQFEVFAAMPKTGDYTMTVALDGTYVGRRFNAQSAAVPSFAEITPRPFQILGLQLWAFVAILVAIAASALVWLFLSKRTRPFGYLYDDQDRLIVDFNRLRRSPLRRLMSADVVNAAEVPGLPFRGAAFRFQGQEVELRYQKLAGDPSLRVNSRPAGPSVKLGRDVWLGVGGRLLTFVSQRKPTASLPAPADD